MLNKENIVLNIKALLDSYFYELYNQYASDDVNKENLSALIFNSILISCQLLEDIESIKALIVELIESNGFNDVIKFYNNPDFVLTKLVSKYSDISYDEILKRLRHGFAVHFTTPKIMEIIKEKKLLSSSNQMFTKEVEELIEKAKRTQYLNTGDAFNCLSRGFGFGDGISISSQTNGYWMNHTPESLSFLFGGYVYLRDKESAFKYIRESINTIDIKLQEEILVKLNEVWDKLIGEDRYLGAILIDRDGIEYEKVTYWNYDPPKVEEIRAYRHDLNDIVSTENSRVHHDIKIEYLTFLKVPSVPMLEEYRKTNIVNKQK